MTRLLEAGVERLTKAGKLQIVEAVELNSTLEKLRACDWVVFIEKPPTYRRDEQPASYPRVATGLSSPLDC